MPGPIALMDSEVSEVLAPLLGLRQHRDNTHTHNAVSLDGSSAEFHASPRLIFDKELFYTPFGKRCLRNSRGEGSYHGGGILELWL